MTSLVNVDRHRPSPVAARPRDGQAAPSAADGKSPMNVVVLLGVGGGQAGMAGTDWTSVLLLPDRRFVTDGESSAVARHAISADLVGLGLRLLVGGCRADWDTVCAETAGVVSMASMCHRSGRAQDDLESRKLPAARCAVAVPGILLEALRGLGMEARPR